jgi:hypothetical protein
VERDSMSDSSREQDAKGEIWVKSGSGSMAAVWQQYANDLSARRSIPLYQALELLLPEVTPGPVVQWYWEHVCIVCGEKADWWRSIEPFIYYGYCDEHARQEQDFDPDPSGYLWMRPH